MASKTFRLRARISSVSPHLVKPILASLFTTGTVNADDNDFLVDATLTGESAKELNRLLLSELRRTEKRTVLRAEWTSGKTTERYFDYVLKAEVEN